MIIIKIRILVKMNTIKILKLWVPYYWFVYSVSRLILFQLWSSGFGISKSLAVGALNGEHINMTMYYLISNVPSPIHEVGRAEREKSELERSLYFPDRCYEGHHTLWVLLNAVIIWVVVTCDTSHVTRHISYVTRFTCVTYELVSVGLRNFWYWDAPAVKLIMITDIISIYVERLRGSLSTYH